MKVIYVIATGEVVGGGSDGISVEAPLAIANAPANYDDYPEYFWNYVDPDIVLKEGAELAAAQAKQNGEVAQVVIDRHAKGDAIKVQTVGAFEENGDVVNQMLLAVVEFIKNGTPLDQTLYDQYVLYHAKVDAHWSTDLATMSEADMDKIAARKAKARANAIDIANDPDWPYAP